MIKDFCTNLINYRQKAHITRKEVADKLGISEIAYGAYERGKRLPDIEKLCALSHLFEITPNELLNFKQDEFVLAKNTWAKYDFQIVLNQDGSVSLIRDYSLDNDRKLTRREGKIDFIDAMLRKKADFVNKQSFILYTKDVVKRYSEESFNSNVTPSEFYEREFGVIAESTNAQEFASEEEVNLAYEKRMEKLIF